MRPAPASARARLAEILTPSLLVSLPVLERNEAACRTCLNGTGVALRAHAKAHKSSGLAQWHMRRAGDELRGLCAQTMTEAEVLVAEGGCRDVLLTNQVVGSSQIARLAALSNEHRDTRIGVLVDSLANVGALSSAISALDPGITISAYVEIDCGQDRCGVPPASLSALALARAILKAPGLRFGGLHVYHGGIQHVRDVEARRNAVARGPAEAARSTLGLLAAAGIEVPVVTGGGTGTFLLDVQAGVHTEVQPGSYLFMDGDYAANHEGLGTFGQSLFVHATVISVDEAAGKRVLDAGTKAVDLLCGVPTLASIDERAPLHPDLAGVQFVNGGDEHGVLRAVPPGHLPLGSKVQLAPSHCDPTVNLHGWLVGVRDGAVEVCWAVDARGPG